MLLGGAAADPTAVVALRVADLPADPEVARCVALRARARPARTSPTRPRSSPATAPRCRRRSLPTWLRRARLVGLSLESNGGLCRSLLRVRHGVPDPTEEVAA